MMGAREAGVNREDWIDWCVADPDYASDGDEIRRLWDALKVDRITAWYFRVEIRLAQMNRGYCPKYPCPPWDRCDQAITLQTNI